MTSTAFDTLLQVVISSTDGAPVARNRTYALVASLTKKLAFATYFHPPTTPFGADVPPAIAAVLVPQLVSADGLHTLVVVQYSAAVPSDQTNTIVRTSFLFIIIFLKQITTERF